jgi:hypothetical protein
MSCNIRFSAFHGTPFIREVLHADVPLLPPVTGVRLPMPEAGLPVTLKYMLHNTKTFQVEERSL